MREDSSLPELARAVAHGDGMALAVLKARVEKKAGSAAPSALSVAEADQWIGTLEGIVAGYSKFSGYGRASSVVVVSEVLQKFQVEPTPANWRGVLTPAAHALGVSMADQTWEVRVAAISEIKALWSWSPACSTSPSDIKWIVGWKESFHDLVKQRLADPDPRARIAAVACLGALPLREESEPAVALIEDRDPAVRGQVLLSFANRPTLLTEEAILPLLHDPEKTVITVAKGVLKDRGLTEDQIGLGSLVTHPRADMRASTFPLLKDRKDVDPVIWLVYLSRDPEEFVRAKAVEALAVRSTEEAKKRLAEMAANDTSPAIRRKAEKLIQSGESTADLPPLPPPGSSLKMKAN